MQLLLILIINIFEFHNVMQPVLPCPAILEGKHAIFVKLAILGTFSVIFGQKLTIFRDFEGSDLATKLANSMLHRNSFQCKMVFIFVTEKSNL